MTTDTAAIQHDMHPPVESDWAQALAAHQRGDLGAAFDLAGRVLDRAPQHLGALNLMASIALQVGQFQVALTFLDLALDLHPSEPLFWMNRGSALHGLNRHVDALQAYDQALLLQPDLAHAHYNRGNTLKVLGRLEDACHSYARCVGLQPSFQEAHHNWGNVLHELGDYPQALQRLDNALALQPSDAQARKNRAMALLMMGRLREGWRDYEARWATPPLNGQQRDRGYPRWDGRQPLAGRSILIHAEQGLGDTIHFCRYASAVKAAGAALVVLEVQPALVPLLRGLAGADLVLPAGLPLPPLDFHIPLLSLPGAFNTNLESIPSTAPYIRPQPHRVAYWQAQVPRGSSVNIGICWQPSAKGLEAGRGIPLSAFAPLAARPGVRLYSLQKEGLNASTVDEPPVHSFGPDFDAQEPFADTAAVMQLLDLVITTDTSVAHLAGALAVPVWTALPFSPDWRWMAVGDTTPWYPSMRLFRQPQRGDWGSVFNAMNLELDRLVA